MTLLSVQQLAEELTRQAEAKQDYVTDTRRIGFSIERISTNPEGDESAPPAGGYPKGGTVTLTLDDVEDSFRVNDFCQEQIGQRLNLPRKFWDRMRENHPDILEDAVTKLFNREPSVRMVRTLDNSARAFLSNRYRRLDNYDLMERSIAPALAGYGTQAQVLGSGLTDLRMYVKVLFPDTSFDDPRGGGHKVYGGIIIGNSEVGSGSLFVEPFTYASYCLNGMIFGKQEYREFGLRKMHVGRAIEDSEAARQMFSDATLRKEDEAFFAMAYDLVKGAASGIQFAAIAEAVQRAADTAISADPVAVVEKLAKQTNVTETERGSIMQHLIEGGNLSVWGYANAVTRTAQDAKTIDRAVELERLGGEMVDWTASAWRQLDAAAAAVAVAA